MALTSSKSEDHAKGGKYIYYRCSKKHGKCNQAYVNSKVLIKQLHDKLESIALPEDWAEIILAEIEGMERMEAREKQSFFKNLEQQIKELDEKLDKLINSFLDGLIEKNVYLNKKDELLKQKVELQERQKDFVKKGVLWVELAREWVELAQRAGKLALSNDFLEIKHFVKKIGSNHRVLDKKVLLDVGQPFSLVSEIRRGRGLWLDCAGAGGGKKEKDTNQKMEDVLSSRDEKIRTSDPTPPRRVL